MRGILRRNFRARACLRGRQTQPAFRPLKDQYPHSRGRVCAVCSASSVGSADFCLICEGQSAQQLKTELESKGAQIELGVVPRMGARGAMQSIYLHDPDGNLVELGVYESGDD